MHNHRKCDLTIYKSGFHLFLFHWFLVAWEEIWVITEKYHLRGLLKNALANLFLVQSVPLASEHNNVAASRVISTVILIEPSWLSINFEYFIMTTFYECLMIYWTSIEIFSDFCRPQFSHILVDLILNGSSSLVSISPICAA